LARTCVRKSLSRSSRRKVPSGPDSGYGSASKSSTITAAPFVCAPIHTVRAGEPQFLCFCLIRHLGRPVRKRLASQQDPKVARERTRAAQPKGHHPGKTEKNGDTRQRLHIWIRAPRTPAPRPLLQIVWNSPAPKRSQLCPIARRYEWRFSFSPARLSDKSLALKHAVEAVLETENYRSFRKVPILERENLSRKTLKHYLKFKTR
jgi:hypothetical protein